MSSVEYSEEVSASEVEEETVAPAVEAEEEEEVDLSSMTKKRRKKYLYRKKLLALFDQYKAILIVGVDNVGSNQMQQVRTSLRGRAIVLMGKNTLMRLVIREKAKTLPKLAALEEHVRGNVGFVFTNENLNEVRKIIIDNKVPAAAKSGQIAQCDVFVPPGPTGMDPGQTEFFQALNIATKISRGSIEIIDTVHLVAEGDKVTSSAVALLSRLGIKPFSYGIQVQKVYEDGAVFAAAVLDLSEDVLLGKFMTAVCYIAAIGMEVGYPTTASVPFQMRNAFKKIAAIGIAAGYNFEMLTELLEGASRAEAAAAAAAAPAEAEEEAGDDESEEESSDGMAFDMFGGGGGDESEEEYDEGDEGDEE